jgi:hypothetical protein
MTTTQHNMPKRLTLEWLKQNNLPLYVRNLTRPRGHLGVNFVQPNGHIKMIKITRSHLPLCLTEQLGWDTILASDDLRICIAKGVLDIVPPDVAEAELSSQEAVDETARTQYSQFSAKHQFIGKRVQDLQETVDQAAEAKTQSLEPLGIETNVIQPRILSLVEKWKNGDVSIKAALSELKIMEEELRETDCSYIIANGPEGQIRNYVQKLLAQIRGRSAAAHDFTQADDEPVMTAEERAQESRREAVARQYQNV